MTVTREPILFLSGAGLGPWVWDEVRHELGAESSVAPRPVEHSSASLVDYAEAALAAAPPGRFAVVAHSSGGVVATEVARLAPHRVSRFLAVAAVVPENGGSFVSAVPIPKRWVLTALMRLGGTRPPASAIRRGLGDGLSRDVVDRVIGEFTPESSRLYLDRTGEHAWSGRRGYLSTTRDREIPSSAQRDFAERLGPDWHEELETGHLPMLEDPTALAGSIGRFLNA